jgi:hypothetical protein
MRIKDFIIAGLEQDIDLKKKEIRLIKKEIRYIWDMKKEVKVMKEEDLKVLLDNDPNLLAKYEELSAMVEEKSKKEITNMIKEGKLREVFLDEHGKVIEDEQPADDTADSGSPQSTDASTGIGGRSDKSSKLSSKSEGVA